MPTEAYALCPRRPMPMSTSYESSKGYILEPRLLPEVGALGIVLWLRLHFNDRLFGNFGQCH